MARPVIFSVVGVVGYIVQTAALWLLVDGVRLPVVPATIIATELAIVHNFIWHLHWTWADRPAGPRATAMRLARFNVANGGISLVGGAVTMTLLVHGLGLHYLPANLLAVAGCTVANYLVGDRWVFVHDGRSDDIGERAGRGNSPLRTPPFGDAPVDLAQGTPSAVEGLRARPAPSNRGTQPASAAPSVHTPLWRGLARACPDQGERWPTS